MHTTKLRKVGGSVMLAVPRPLLRLLELEPGQALSLEIRDGRLVARPQPAPHYSLDQLLKEWTSGGPGRRNPKRDSEWLGSPPAGRELL